MNRPLFESVLVDHKHDGFIGTTAESVTWLSGYWAMPQWIRRGPQAYAFQPHRADAKSFIVTGTGLIDHAADQELYVASIHRYGFFASEGLEAGIGDEAERLRKMQQSPQHDGPGEALAHALCCSGVDGNLDAISPSWKAST